MDDSQETETQDWQFRAFVSYSHSDKAKAARLQKRLETYRLPKHLRGKVQSGRIGRIFRDLDEFPAAEDLTESIKQALASSEALIVLCSPSSKKSLWVAREIELFRELHPERPILAALFSGEPHEAFPEPLMQGREPLAADFRKQGDGERLGFLKVVAGVVGVPLSTLLNRDAQRRLRRVMAVTGVALTAMIVMALMTTFALQSRDTARAAQLQAEEQARATQALNAYLVGDFKDVLNKHGLIEIAMEFYPRVLEYCKEQNVRFSNSDISSESCAELMRTIGRNLVSANKHSEAREYLQVAHETFESAHAITADRLKTDSQNPSRIMDHVLSTNRIGFSHVELAEYSKAISTFHEAKALMEKVDRRTKNSPSWLLHSAYLNANIGSTIIKSGQHGKSAMPYMVASVKQTIEVVRLNPQDTEGYYALAFHIQWLGMAHLKSSTNGEAQQASEIAIEIADILTSLHPGEQDFLQQRMEVYKRHSEILEEIGRIEEAKAFLAIAISVSDQLSELDRKNEDYQLN